MAFFDLATTQPLEINSLHGKVLLLNLWAAWSPASAKELPELVALEEDYSKKGLVVLGVCLDDAPAAGLLVFAERHGIRYPLVRPGPLMVDLVEPVETIPYTILLNNEGKVIGRFRSPIKRAELRAAIEKNL
jgi:glutathione peroxidase-family protein